MNTNNYGNIIPNRLERQYTTSIFFATPNQNKNINNHNNDIVNSPISPAFMFNNTENQNNNNNNIFSPINAIPINKDSEPGSATTVRKILTAVNGEPNTTVSAFPANSTPPKRVIPQNIDALPRESNGPICPEGPNKYKRPILRPDVKAKSTKLDGVSQLARDVSERRQQEYINDNGDKTYFTITRMMNSAGQYASGHYMQAFTIDYTRDRLSNKYTNNQILFKSFTGARLESDPNRIEEFMTNTINQYDALKTLGVPVAEIINKDTAKKDGFYMVQRIPHEFKIEWTPTTKLNQLSSQTQDLLNQVKTMFKIAYDNKIHADIKRDNVRIDDNNKAVLIDFREDIQEDKYCANPFALEVPKFLRTFADGNREIYDFLNPM